jgi:hypothetical protein
MGEREKPKKPGRAAAWISALLGRLRPGRREKDVHPGVIPVYAPSKFRALDEPRDT